MTKSTATAKKSYAQQALDNILKSLDEGVAPWEKPWDVVGGFPKNAYGRPYSGWNVLWLSIQGYANPYFLTFNKVKELGGNVKKGEHGTGVLYWRKDEKQVEKINEDGNTELVSEDRFYIGGYTVFNATQCENLPKKYYPEVKKRDNNPIVDCENIVKGYADCPKIFNRDASKAFYSPCEDYINVPNIDSFHSSEDYYATLFHEMNHSTGHSSRLNRKSVMDGSRFGSEQYGREELIAEVGAQILLHYVGINKTTENSASYCENWAKALRETDSASAVISAFTQAFKSAQYILGKHEEEEE